MSTKFLAMFRCFATLVPLLMIVSSLSNSAKCILATHWEPKIDFGYDNLWVGLDPSGVLELELQHQNIPVLKAGTLQNLPNFYKLKLEYDRITVVQPAAFINVTSLSRVSLQANNIREIPEGIFSSSGITTLYLGNNSISYIASGAFDNMAHLRIVQLNNNSLQVWNPRWFKNSPKVQFVLFQFNQIAELPAKAFWNIRRSDYVYIDLSHNRIEHVDVRTFQGLGTLEVLHLEYNNVKHLDDALFVNSRKLEYLTVNNNELLCLSDDFLKSLVRRIDLRIENNLMDCGCLNNISTWANLQNSSADTANNAAKELKRKCSENETFLEAPDYFHVAN